MATVQIDGKTYNVADRDNLLHACLSLGLDIPYFCWHPAMGSVGACRQCAVKQFHDENDKRGRIVMSCMAAANDGARIAINDPEVTTFRASIIEWLMTNHPHDCPVCEEGGECHLQDMTLMTGHVYRRYRFTKRTFRNQYLGPFLTHEMNRCIACYRCVRFYRDYAGGRDFDVFAVHNHVYFGRHEDGVLENEFSGNLAEVCPTGVFDDKPFGKAFNRKWDLQSAPSICVHCGNGCNTTLNARFGEVRRTLNRYNGQVNGYFLCDRGRFGRGFVNGSARIREPLLKRNNDGQALPASRTEALHWLAERMARGAVIGIGSPRASLEANFALRTFVGAEGFYLGTSDGERRLILLILDILRNGPACAASLKDAEDADAVLILGENVPDTAPRLALSLRQAVRQKSFEVADRLKIPRWQDAGVREAARQERQEDSPLYIATPDVTRLDDVATRTVRAAPDDIARLGFAVTHEIDASAPTVRGLSDEFQRLAGEIAQVLKSAKRPLVVAGCSCGSAAVIQSAASVAWALCGSGHAAKLCLTMLECNSFGLGMIGGGALADAFKALEDGRAQTLIVLENDLYRRAARSTVDRGLDAAQHIIVFDHIATDTARRADLLIPAATFAESDGTLVSNEGRAQRFFQLIIPQGDVQESWRWLRDAMQPAGRLPATDWARIDEVTAACAQAVPGLGAIPQVAPDACFRIGGSKIPREPHRYSGRTAIDAAITVHEPKPPNDPDTPLAYSMEGYYGPRLPPPLIPYFWAPSWNSVQALNKFQDEVGGPLRGGDPGVRLVEPPPDAAARRFDDVPDAFAPRRGEWLILPSYEIFGSEELSRLAPAIAERTPSPYVALNSDDAAHLGIIDGAAVTVNLEGATARLSARIRPALPSGIAALAVGLSASIGAGLPAWGTVTAADGASPAEGNKP
ncbi:MAG TPA: NADH-quinone oxidoreductase subunit NuoG [Xanthobacteraceae bacterium]|jgi:NADH-quinone oxidoreductase subunit G